jgi:hypothetical protein
MTTNADAKPNCEHVVAACGKAYPKRFRGGMDILCWEKSVYSTTAFFQKTTSIFRKLNAKKRREWSAK